MNETMQRHLAREFAVARRTNGVIDPQGLEELIDLADAYRLQERVRVELGATVVGWKLAQPQAGEVISAPLLDIGSMASGAFLADAALLRDGVECELALRLDHSLPIGECTRGDAMAAIGAVMPAFELLCSRLPAKFASPRAHIVGDGMGNGAVVLGAPCTAWRRLDFAKMRVTLSADDAPVVDKQGGNPFGDPVQAVVLLSNHLSGRGQTLEAGTFVLAGSHTGVHRARPGERLRCVFEEIGHVALNVQELDPTISREHVHAGR
jgi:2-keto-4-pentenoate hydratase